MKRPRTTIVSPKTSAAAAPILGSIDDLLIQVFLRIPLKQLCPLKLVSKHWNSIISDPKLHLSLRKPEPAVGLIFNLHIVSYIHHPYYKSYFLNFDQPTTPKLIGRGVKVLHSCNGLLLCETDSCFARHYIYNPITKKTSTLPTRMGVYPCGKYLSFDPSKPCHYKFVCVVGLGQHFFTQSQFNHDRFRFEVYSSKTASWGKCGEPFSATVDFESGVYWKGAIHWLSLTKAGNSIYFNPDDDRMLPTVMPSPPILEDAKLRHYPYGKNPSPWFMERNYHFGESCGHLNFIDAYSKLFEFNVYEMKTDYSEWFVKYRVDLSNVFVNNCLFSICTLVRGNKDDDTFLVLRVGDKFMRCNLVDKTCETILECKGIELEKELLGDDGEFPLQYFEGAYGNGVWATVEEIKSLEDHLDGVSF